MTELSFYSRLYYKIVVICGNNQRTHREKKIGKETMLEVINDN